MSWVVKYLYMEAFVGEGINVYSLKEARRFNSKEDALKEATKWGIGYKPVKVVKRKEKTHKIGDTLARKLNYLAYAVRVYRENGLPATVVDLAVDIATEWEALTKDGR